MKMVLGAAIAAAAFTVPAAAFDNSTCPTFLVGKWAMTVPEGTGSLTMNFGDGGVMTMDMTHDGKTDTMTGTWTAAAGDSPDQCKVTATEKGQAEKPGDTTTATVKDDNTIVLGEMGEFKRQ